MTEWHTLVDVVLANCGTVTLAAAGVLYDALSRMPPCDPRQEQEEHEHALSPHRIRLAYRVARFVSELELVRWIESYCCYVVDTEAFCASRIAASEDILRYRHFPIDCASIHDRLHNAPALVVVYASWIVAKLAAETISRSSSSTPSSSTIDACKQVVEDVSGASSKDASAATTAAIARMSLASPDRSFVGVAGSLCRSSQGILLPTMKHLDVMRMIAQVATFLEQLPYSRCVFEIASYPPSVVSFSGGDDRTLISVSSWPKN